MCPEQLNTCVLWWNGPEWLKSEDWPSYNEEAIPDGMLPEKRKPKEAFHI